MLLTTGELVRVDVTLVGDAHLGQQCLGRFCGFGLALAQHATWRLNDVVEHAHVRPEIEVLEYEAELAAHLVDLLGIGSDQLAVFGAF